MATRRKRRTARRRKSTAVAAPRRRSRRMGAARKTTRRRRMGASRSGMMAEVGVVGQMAIGALASGMLGSLIDKAMPDSVKGASYYTYVKGGALLFGGVMLGKALPKAKYVGYGVSTMGAVMIGGKLLAGTGLLNGSRRDLGPDAYRRITRDVRSGARIGTGTKSSTLTGNLATPRRQHVIMGIHEDMFSE